MLEVSEKLKKFSTEVLSEASQLSKKQWESFVEKQQMEYDRKETEFLEAGYYYIQNGLKQIDKEKSSHLSKSLMENRQRVLRTRVEIIEEVFEELKKRLHQFVKTEEYNKVLFGRIEKTLAILGEGPKKIVLTEADMQKKDILQKHFVGVELEAESKQAKNSMIGGCRGYHKEKKVFYDNSFAEQIEVQKSGFLQNVASELKIVD